MRSLNWARIFRFKGIFGLCMCLVLVGIIILSAAERTAAAPATGSLPVIKVFTGDPLTLPDGGHVVYTFEVYDATKIQVVEAGYIINEYNGPPSTTSKGTSIGGTTYQIRTDGMDKFDTVLRANNLNGQRVQKITISFATKSKPKPTSLIPPVSDNRTGNKNKWGPQTSASRTSTPSAASTVSNWPPQFAKCPKGCNYCIKPEEAAAKGLTQKCLEQPCYYSPDKQQNWFCYGEPVSTGWCCKDGKVTQADRCKETGGVWYATEAEAITSRTVVGYCCKEGQTGQAGQVTEATECQCTQEGADHWSLDKNRAIQDCQGTGWFCSGSKVYQGSQAQATQAGVTWYATEAEATKACVQVCWCCTKGAAALASQVTQMNPADCAKAGGTCYTTQDSAAKACEQTGGYCCSNGNLTPATPTQCAAVKGVYYTDPAKGKELCQPSGYGCINGRVAGPMTQAQADQAGVKLYANQQDAINACLPPPGYCCLNGKTTSSTEAQCKGSGGTYWSTNQAQVIERCQPPPGYCCINGKVSGPTTQTQCGQMGGAYYATQSQAMANCQPLGYCCIGGSRVTGPVSQTQCSQMGGTNWSTSQERVAAVCQQTYYCCRDGQVYQSKTPGTGCYTNPTEAQQACQRTYWCCSNGQVYQSKTLGRGCYTTQAEAQQACQPTYWCCRNGQVYQSKTPGTGCYATQAEATRACQKLLAAPPLQQ